MFRIKILVVVLGGVALFIGGREFFVSSGTSSEPVEVELVDLESDPTPPNNHITIGEHLALYPACVYEYRTSKYSSAPPDADTSITCCYYAALSYDSSFIAELGELVEKYDGLENVPDSEEGPDIKDVAVLVKTKRFKTIGVIPDEIADEQSITGLVINRIDSLDKEEKKLLKESFPLVDLDRVLILEDGRKPASLVKSLGLIGIGLLFLVGGIVWMLENVWHRGVIESVREI